MAPRLSPAEALERALVERRILVACGSGGVGKTTTAAALAVRAARSGRRVLVCTIDPSRRLATSLGLNQLSGRPRPIDLSRLAPYPARGGALWAMVLDVKSTFDALVARYTPDAAARARILENRFYRHVSAALAGTHEYMAMEKLLELRADERWDLVVLDTPPTRHALDFLDAPDRLLGFLDTSVLRWFLRPYFVAGRLTLKVATRTGAVALRLADRFLGLQFLQDLSEFFLAFESMYDGFKERATRVHALLRDGSSGFVMVAGPQPLALEEALYFHRRLAEKGMPFVAFVVNRVHLDPARERRARRGVRPALPPGLAARLAETLREQQVLARVERRAVARLEVDTRERPVLVPELEQDVHDLRGLAEFGDLVFGGARARSRPARAAVGR
ncbi:MAG TPA: ArsA-related P-loop ATPase [Vicinamibacteria bacterium]|nr:ArsA-related P-loop ATPase [Vicinamibacteria bacterium]